MKLKLNWNKQELECLQNKRSGGCNLCPIYYIYKIKNCRMFPQVLKKFALIGEPNL